MWEQYLCHVTLIFECLLRFSWSGLSKNPTIQFMFLIQLLPNDQYLHAPVVFIFALMSTFSFSHIFCRHCLAVCDYVMSKTKSPPARILSKPDLRLVSSKSGLEGLHCSSHNYQMLMLCFCWWSFQFVNHL